MADDTLEKLIEYLAWGILVFSGVWVALRVFGSFGGRKTFAAIIASFV